MAKLRRLALAGIPVVSWGYANAADLPPAPSLPEQTAEEEFSGWYLRGDVGGGVNSAGPELETAPEAPAASAAAAARRFDNATLSPFGMVDVGAGYQFNSWFRTDATLEYRAGANLHSPASLTFAGPAQYADFYRADVASIVGLVNGYANLGTWYGLSPFLGVGVGLADTKVSGFTDQGPGYTNYGDFANGSKTSFAWALMAGVDFDLTPNFKLELGYRYLNYGTITTGGSNCLTAESGGTLSLADCRSGVASTIASRNRLASNDFRLGLIYLIGEAPAPPVVAR